MNMISDGDSSAYETIKHIYINVLLKDRVRSNSLNNYTSMDFINENSDNNPLSQLTPQEYESNLVQKEDCINHIKKRVSYHLKITKARYSGFENGRQASVSSTRKKKNEMQLRKRSSSYSNVCSSSDDDDIEKPVQSSTKSRRRTRLSDGKPYGGGVGRMTKAMEHKLADYYGIAIRQSSESAKSLFLFLKIRKIRVYHRFY